jgi:uncharacterized protein (DUF4415 family)
VLSLNGSKNSSPPNSTAEGRWLSKKVLQTLRLEPEVIDYVKDGDPKNWLTRINTALSQLARGETVLTAKPNRKTKKAA